MKGLYNFLRPYSGDLWLYLAGYSYETAGFTEAKQFGTLFLIMLGVTILSCVLFYFLPKSVKRVRLIWWILWLVVTGAVNWAWSTSYVFREMNMGYIDPTYFTVQGIDAVAFGMQQFLFSLIVFFVFSLFFKGFNPNLKNRPFKVKRR